MRRSIILFFTLLTLVSFIIWTGCFSKAREGSSQQSTGSSTPPPTMEAPEWFTSIPQDNDHLYAAATASARDLQNAFDMAKQSAMVDIAGQVETKISGMFKRFAEEVGAGEDAELIAQTTAVAKSLVQQVLSGCKTLKQERRQEGDKHRAYVLVQMPARLADTALVNRIKGDKDLYTQFRSSQAFAELEAEVAKTE